MPPRCVVPATSSFYRLPLLPTCAFIEPRFHYSESSHPIFSSLRVPMPLCSLSLILSYIGISSLLASFPPSRGERDSLSYDWLGFIEAVLPPLSFSVGGADDFSGCLSRVTTAHPGLTPPGNLVLKSCLSPFFFLSHTTHNDSFVFPRVFLPPLERLSAHPPHILRILSASG